MTKEAFMKGADGNPKAVEINKGLVLERNTKRVTNLSKNEKIYAQGDGLLKIAPFDNYYLFTIYSEMNLEDVPVDIHNMGSFFLTFKDKESEVRVENYRNTKDVDPTNGQILFRISQEDAEKILSMDTNVFYVTSMLYDDRSKSDETVLYSGKFAEYNDANVSFLTDEITNLNKELDTVKKEKLEKETQLQKQINELSDTLVKLRSDYSALEDNLKVYKDAYAELSKDMQDYQSEVEARIKELEIQSVDESLQENGILAKAVNTKENKYIMKAAFNVLSRDIPGIKTEVVNTNKQYIAAAADNITIEEANRSFSNINVKTGVVVVYAFMHTLFADLDTEDEKIAYNSLDDLFTSTQTYVNTNKYNNIEYHIIHAEYDPGKLMNKYNITKDCIVVTKDGETLGMVVANDASTPATIIQRVENIIKLNNN